MRFFRRVAVTAGLVLAGCGGGAGTTADPAGQPTSFFAAPAGGGSADERPPGEPLPKIEKPTLADLLAPGPLPERILGRVDAPVTLIEYVSLTCPYCRAFHEKVLADIKRQYIDKGQVRLIVREFPIGKSAGAATIANRCVATDKYFALLNRFLLDQKAWVSQEVRRDAIYEVAAKEGLKRSEFDACFENKQLAAALNQIKERGRRLGVVGTPTFFVQDKKLRTAPSADDIKRALDEALQRAASAAAR